MKLEDKKGNKLIKLHKVDETDIHKKFSKLTHSLIVCTQAKKVLFILNNWKKLWELPGGIIEDNESPRDCAIRELREETNKTPQNLEFHSVMEWRLGKEQKKEFGALYFCDIEGEAETLNTEEVGKTLFWDLQSEIGEVAELDITLSETVLSGKGI